ncbi:MAG: threonine--tRNA ligase, partial [Alphaproteobacteria bacterium]|nr:threonine--tRNA ligase [Alphaproteobacteria bacterium]
EVQAKMKAAGLRGDVDLRNEKINLKVREHSLAKVPVIVAVGRQEVESGKVAVRRLGEKGQQILDLDDAIASLVEESRIPGT